MLSCRPSFIEPLIIADDSSRPQTINLFPLSLAEVCFRLQLRKKWLTVHVENIGLNSTTDRERIVDAAGRASAASFIEKLPEQYDASTVTKWKAQSNMYWAPGDRETIQSHDTVTVQADNLLPDVIPQTVDLSDSRSREAFVSRVEHKWEAGVRYVML